MTDNIKSLLPCPFCSSMRTAIGYNGQPAVTIFAMCQDCGATGPTQQYSSGMSFDWEAAWQRRAPVADSTMAKDAPGNCHKCGLPLSVNPHPEAGKPPHYLIVGCPKECIPCLSLSRHAWSRRAMEDAKDAERYRFLRGKMGFTEVTGKPPTMSLCGSIPAPAHSFDTGWMGDSFDESVDETIDAAIAASAEKGDKA